MRRVLLLIKGLGRGGAEQLLVSSVRHADATRFIYEVAYLLPWKAALVSDLEAAGVTVHCLDGARGGAWIRRLRSLVRERGFEIVHGHSPYPMVGARLALRGRSHLVYTEHNLWSRYHPATFWSNLLTYSMNEHVFAVSDSVRISARYPAPLRFLRMPPVETLYHGPDPAALAAADASEDIRASLGVRYGVPLVGTVANLKAHKGYPHLLHAAQYVRQAVPEARFVLVGQGPMEAELRHQAQELGLDGTVIFAGYREDALSVIKTFDVFVLPSLFEGLSIALMEAMALGKPSVVTRVGGLPEVVTHEEHGLVVPPADPRALAQAIVALLRDKSWRTRLGSAARVRAMDFDIRQAVRRVEDVYEELLI
jgi:glycosyltransferase involved in cell wall biosynthesis